MMNTKNPSAAAMLWQLRRTYGFSLQDLAYYLRLRNHVLYDMKAWDATAQDTQRLARLRDLVEQLTVLRIEDPAKWFLTPITYRLTLTPWDLLDKVPDGDLLDFAVGKVTAEQFIEQHEPRWYELYERHYHVTHDRYGTAAIVRSH